MDPRLYMKWPYPPLPTRTQALSSETFKVPPLDGSLTIVQMLDWQAEHSPGHSMYEYAEDDGSIVKLKFPEVRRAVHRGARLIEKALPTRESIRDKVRPLIAVVANAGGRRMVRNSPSAYHVSRHRDVQYYDLGNHEERPACFPYLTSQLSHSISPSVKEGGGPSCFGWPRARDAEIGRICIQNFEGE